MKFKVAQVKGKLTYLLLQRILAVALTCPYLTILTNFFMLSSPLTMEEELFRSQKIF